jgi:hypothetical protein
MDGNRERVGEIGYYIERLRVWLDDCALPAYNLNQSIRTSDEAHWTTPTAELRLIASTHDRVTL